MAQRKETVVRYPVALVDDAELATAESFTAKPGYNPDVPLRAQRKLYKQLLKQEAVRIRSAAAIGNIAELTDEANTQVVGSLGLSKHLEKGFGEDIDEQEKTYFKQANGILLGGSANILRNAAQKLIDQTDDDDLPDTDVTALEVAWEWLKTH